MSPLETCLYWRNHGISVVPLYYRSKQPHSRALIDTGFVKECKGVKQATWQPLKDKPATVEQIEAWCQYQLNLALVTTGNLIVIDFDNHRHFTDWYCWQVEYNPSILDTYIVQSSRGLHYYYWIVEPFEPINITAYTVQALNKINQGKKRKLERELATYEIKSHGQMINIPPSVHPCGIEYKPLGKPDDILSIAGIEEILTFSPVKFERPKPKRSIWSVVENGNGVDIEARNDKVLALFPDAKETATEGYYLSDCPFHGHKDNFMLNVNKGVAYCYAGCGSFLFSELLNDTLHQTR